MDNEKHYNDGTINIDIIEFDCQPVISLVSNEGRCKALDPTSNFFTAKDIIDAYIEIFPEGYEDEIEGKVAELREWLLQTGASQDELG